MGDIKEGAPLKKTEVDDKSAPVIDENAQIKKIDRNAHLGAISEGVNLNKADTVDKSAPKLPSAAKIEDRNAVVADIANANVELKKAETVDKSAPVIEGDVQIKKLTVKHI